MVSSIMLSSIIIVSCAIATGARTIMTRRAAVARMITLFNRDTSFYLLVFNGLHSFSKARSYP